MNDLEINFNLSKIGLKYSGRTYTTLNNLRENKTIKIFYIQGNANKQWRSYGHFNYPVLNILETDQIYTMFL